MGLADYRSEMELCHRCSTCKIFFVRAGLQTGPKSDNQILAHRTALESRPHDLD